MDKVRIGIIGIGSMGSMHAAYISKGDIPNAELTAVCDIDPERLKWARSALGDKIRLFDDSKAFFDSHAM
ncbi:MAG TPA: Gfo/Idh/MocA family oxidoreductase, partial [Candidatus Atribacteria bacterium]|nr:Gfo/Idh/MocA family oxidoreductase [Candidatus Atribacteria bacterium]